MKGRYHERQYHAIQSIPPTCRLCREEFSSHVQAVLKLQRFHNKPLEDISEEGLRQCSCGNRHCPTQQNEKAAQWLQTQTQKLLPCNYFFITLTMPEGLRCVVRSHQRSAYAALFSCAMMP